MRHFNPQGPHGPRQKKKREMQRKIEISIHKALTGLDDEQKQWLEEYRISIHKALTGLDSNFHQFLPAFLQFSKHNASFFSFNSPPYPKIPIFYALFPAFSSANIPTFPCPLHIRTKKSTVLPHQIQALPLYAPPYFYIGFPDYKISGCLYLYQ